MVFANEGLRGLVYRGRRRLWLRERYFIYVRRLDGDLPPVSVAGSIEVRPADAAQRASLTRSGPGLGIARYGQLLYPEADCYIAWDGERIAACCWVSPKNEPNGLVQLEPGDVVLGLAATIPDYQGRGVYKMLMWHICAARQQQGDRRAWAVIRPDNAAPIRTFEKLGFHHDRNVLVIRRFGWQRVRVEVGASLRAVAPPNVSEHPKTRHQPAQ